MEGASVAKLENILNSVKKMPGSLERAKKATAERLARETKAKKESEITDVQQQELDELEKRGDGIGAAYGGNVPPAVLQKLNSILFKARRIIKEGKRTEGEKKVLGEYLEELQKIKEGAKPEEQKPAHPETEPTETEKTEPAAEEIISAKPNLSPLSSSKQGVSSEFSRQRLGLIGINKREPPAKAKEPHKSAEEVKPAAPPPAETAKSREAVLVLLESRRAGFLFVTLRHRKWFL